MVSTDVIATDVAKRAWAWVAANLSSFILPAQGLDHVVVQHLKPLSELALAAELLRRAPARCWQDTSLSASDAMEFCWMQLRNGEVLFDLIARYPDLFALVSTYASFYRFGSRNSRLGGLIQHLCKARGVAALEFPAWRGLDVSNALRCLGIEGGVTTQSLLSATWLASEPEPWLLSESAAYSVTHTVFYTTDFGTTPTAMPEQLRLYLGFWLPTWCEYYARLGNMDLLGEMLMVDACMHEGIDTRAYWMRLQSAQFEDGIVPGPVDVSITEGFPDNIQQRAAFWAHYHTTLVAIMAEALSRMA